MEIQLNKQSIVAFIASLIIVVALLFGLKHQISGEAKSPPLNQTLALPEGTDSAPVPASLANEESNWQQTVSQRGDNLTKVLRRLNIKEDNIARLQQLDQQKKLGLPMLRVNKTIRALIDSDHQLIRLEYPKSAEQRVVIYQDAKGFHSKTVTLQLETRTHYATGIIQHSLFKAGQDAGLPEKLIYQMATIFGWNIDFARDISAGDHFTVIYQDYYHGDKKVKTGEILAAQFTNRGTTYRMIGYQLPDNKFAYYTPEGLSNRRAFLRAPVKFTRISSRFTVARKHPVLHRIRAHKGIDYAAPRGTPVHATSDGRIVFRGRKGGYGNVVMLKYGWRYTTVYAHMSRFARGQKVGKSVKQGDVIGYVGSTGLATGPHLHYELRVVGVARDPEKVKLPNAKPLPKKFIEDFKHKANNRIAQLELYQSAKLAEHRS